MNDLIIGGLQKTTMIDFPGKVACTIFTKGCNLRCPYCHNSILVLGGDNELTISEDEVFAFLRKRKAVLDGVCISGGEPLMHKGLVDFIGKIKEMEYLVKLDTNGFFPTKLKDLINKGLVDYVAMDIKNSPNNYGQAAGVSKLDIKKIHDSIEILKTSQIPFEFRTTAVKGIHTEKDFASIAKWIEGPYLYFIQNYENSGETIATRTNETIKMESFTKEELKTFLELIKEKVPNAKIRYA